MITLLYAKEVKQMHEKVQMRNPASSVVTTSPVVFVEGAEAESPDWPAK